MRKGQEITDGLWSRCKLQTWLGPHNAGYTINHLPVYLLRTHTHIHPHTCTHTSGLLSVMSVLSTHVISILHTGDSNSQSASCIHVPHLHCRHLMLPYCLTHLRCSARCCNMSVLFTPTHTHLHMCAYTHAHTCTHLHMCACTHTHKALALWIFFLPPS